MATGSDETVLDVWFEDRLVGHLERRSESVADIVFRYAPSWPPMSGAFPVSLSMPLARPEHDAATTYAWFMNLLPEGRALQLVGGFLRISEVDVFAMLKEMGGDLPGALEIRRHGNPLRSAAPCYRKLTASELADCLRRLPERPMLVGEAGISMSAAGAQDKLPVVRYRDGTLGLPLNGAPSTHIVKPGNPRFRASVINEAYCLRLARAAGLWAVPVEIGSAEEIDYLLVQRYDRAIAGTTVRRHHQEDMCQATGHPPFLKYEWNREIARSGPGVADCMAVLGRTAGQAANKARFFDHLLFNVLAGNVDAHSKNYSLIIRGTADIAVAPLYDIMNGDIYPDVTRNLAMRIGDRQRGGHIHGRHWERFARRNGLSSTHVKRRVAEISRTVLTTAPLLAETMDRELGRGDTCREISGYVTDYCRRMLANLSMEAPSPEEYPAPVPPDGEADLSP